MHFLFHLLHPGTVPAHGSEHESQPPEVITLPRDENTSEGGEFMDDALRMEDVETLPTA